MLVFRYAGGGESAYFREDGSPLGAWGGRGEATRFDSTLEAHAVADQRWADKFRAAIQVVEVKG